MGCGCGNKNKTAAVVQAPAQTSAVEVTKNIRQSHVYDETDPIYLQRLDVCNSCEFRDAVQERCKACGCFLKAKARLVSAKCPLPEPKW